MHLFDRLGSEIVHRCVVVDCMTGELFVVDWIIYDVRARKPIEVIAFSLDRFWGSVSNNRLSLTDPDRLNPLAWELIREVDYVPF